MLAPVRIACLLVALAVGCNSGSKASKQSEQAPVRAPAADAAVTSAPSVPTLTRCGDLARGMCAVFERCRPHRWFAKWNDRKNCEDQNERDCRTWAIAGSKVS